MRKVEDMLELVLNICVSALCPVSSQAVIDGMYFMNMACLGRGKRELMRDRDLSQQTSDELSTLFS